MKKLLICMLVFFALLSINIVAVTGISSVTFAVNSPSEIGDDIMVTGSFTADKSAVGMKYYVFLARLDSSLQFESAEVSEKFTVVEGINNFAVSFDVKSENQTVKAFLLTESLVPLADRIQKQVTGKYLEWNTSDKAFYQYLLSDKITIASDFSKCFAEDGEVTVAEGVTMASFLNAEYRNVDVKSAVNNDFRFDFNDTQGITPYHSILDVSDGILVLTADAPNSNGVYDPGVYLDNLDFEANDYDKMTVRMKRDVLPNVDPDKTRTEKLQVYFQTSNDLKFSGDRCVYFNLKTLGGEDVLTDWFEIEIPLSDHELWADYITRIRFDTTDNNGIYYIDYIVFSKDAENGNEKWYDKYVDYALENNIIRKGEFAEADYERKITRAEFCWLIAASLPEECFGSINSINAISDMDKNDYYADIVLMLCRAGVTFVDADGNFNPDSFVLRSEAAAMLNKAAVPNNRIKGNVEAEWAGMYYLHDLEFDNPDDVDELYTSSTRMEIVDGHLILVPEERPDNTPPKFDPQVGNLNTLIRADEFTTLKVRMKLELEGEVTSMKGEFYYKPEGTERFSEENSLRPRPDFDADYYVDAAGWRVYTFYLGTCETWKGNITAFRFDPTNNAGKFTIDYIRFIRNEGTIIIPEEELANNYNARRLVSDASFENGFDVYTPGDRETGLGKGEFEGLWKYNDTENNPSWLIGPWWTDYKLLENRDETTDNYTLADRQGIKSVIYNPVEKSVSMRLNTDKVFGGQGCADGELWPHLLIEQINYDENWQSVPEDKKKELDLGADKVYVEMDVRINDYQDLDEINRDIGCRSVVQYNVYLYVSHKNVPGFRTYFGVNPFDSRGLKKNIDFWQDGYSVFMIYTVPTAAIFGGAENTFLNDDGTFDIGEWKNVRFDITPYLEDLAAKLTKQNTLGFGVSRDDFWLSGLNVGFEIQGNYRCEVEAKNVNVVCYDKKAT